MFDLKSISLLCVKLEINGNEYCKGCRKQNQRHAVNDIVRQFFDFYYFQIEKEEFQKEKFRNARHKRNEQISFLRHPKINIFHLWFYNPN